MIGDRPFVNNASFGAYAEIVQSPEYRDNKNRTMLAMLPDLLSGESGTPLTVRDGGRTLTDLQAVLVSNNPYGSGRASRTRPPDPARSGDPGILAGHLASAAEAVSLLRGQQNSAITSSTAHGEVIVDAEDPDHSGGHRRRGVAVDTPVHCTIRPRALRVRLPKVRPGVPPPPPKIDVPRLWQIALGRNA